MLGGALWEQTRPAPPINEIASGSSLPTPVKYDADGGRGATDNYHGLGWQARYGDRGFGTSGTYPQGYVPAMVEHAQGKATSEPVKRRTWSTPTVTQPMMPPATLEARMADGKHEGKTSVPLVEVLQREALAKHRATLIPTPGHVNGLRGGSNSDHQPMMWQSPGHPEYGELSPAWVEWLMGWPIGWTSITPMNPDNFVSWQAMQSGKPGQADWWLKDPSDEPLTEISKTVPKGSKRDNDIRVHRIGALGNGQVSAAAAAAFMHLWDQPDPEGA